MASIEIRGLGDLIKNLKKQNRDIEKIAMKAIESTANEGASDIRKAVNGLNKVDTGAYQKSIKNTPAYIKGSEVISEIYSDSEYADIIEEGRRPDQKPPPPQALVGWASRKGIIAGGPTTSINQLPSEEKGIIYAIARAVGKNGVKGMHIFDKQLQSMIAKKKIEKRLIESLNLLLT
ncbi:MAG: HK97 gp10 family phage protein [Bacteroidota bacterium]